MAKKQKSKIKIFVSYHKEHEMLEGNLFIPIHVGRALASEETKKNLSNIIGDDTGDNISAKNPNYCELTAQYWAWKNSDSDYIGFFHYRRFLGLKSQAKLPLRINEITPKIKDDCGWTKKNIERLLHSYDLILPNFRTFDNKDTTYTQYAEHHYIEDLDTAVRIIVRDYPDFVPATTEYLADNKGIYCNMFIMKREIFNDYSKWLFDILFKAEKQIKIREDNYQKRVFGFLSERLFNIYIRYLTAKNPELRILYTNIVHYSKTKLFNEE